MLQGLPFGDLTLLGFTGVIDSSRSAARDAATTNGSAGNGDFNTAANRSGAMVRGPSETAVISSAPLQAAFSSERRERSQRGSNPFQEKADCSMNASLQRQNVHYRQIALLH